MTIFQRRHDGRAAQAPACNPGHPGSIPGRVSTSGFFQISGSSVVERGTVNAQVARSSRAPRANFPKEGAARRGQSGLENRGCRDERMGFDPSAFRQTFCLGSSVVEHGIETPGVARSIRALRAISTPGHAPRPATEPPKLSAVGSIPAPGATLRNVNQKARLGPPAKRIDRSNHCGCGWSPLHSAIHASEADTVYVPRWIVDPEHQNHSPFESDLAHHLRLRLS